MDGVRARGEGDGETAIGTAGCTGYFFVTVEENDGSHDRERRALLPWALDRATGCGQRGARDLIGRSRRAAA